VVLFARRRQERNVSRQPTNGNKIFLVIPKKNRHHYQNAFDTVGVGVFSTLAKLKSFTMLSAAGNEYVW